MDNNTTKTPNPLSGASDVVSNERIKLVGVMHLAGNLLGGGVIGTLLVIGFLFMEKDISPKVKKVCYQIINFNLSFAIYMIACVMLIFTIILAIIGIPALVIGGFIWFVLLILGFIKHLAGDDYKYPMSIEFLKFNGEVSSTPEPQKKQEL